MKQRPDAGWFQRALRAVSAASKVPVDDILGRGRVKNVTAPRMALIRIARSRGYSFSQIAKRLGGRDHSTIISGLRNASRYVARGCDVGIAIAEIEAKARDAMAAETVPRPFIRPSEPAPVPKTKPVPRAGMQRNGFIDQTGAIICDP